VQNQCKPKAESFLYAEAQPDFAGLFHIKALQRYGESTSYASFLGFFMLIVFVHMIYVKKCKSTKMTKKSV